MHPTSLWRTEGQSLPVVVLMLAVLFALIGLAIDGGLLYTQRRLMQNTADAACLAAANRLALGETNVEAEAAAQGVITENLGATPGGAANAPGTLSYAAVAEVYGPNEGSGEGLTRGLEIGVNVAGTAPGPQVRVALRSPAFAYFMGLLGQPEYTVAARARCDATAGGGGTPFAVARWRAYENDNLPISYNNQGRSNPEIEYCISTDLPISNQNCGPRQNSLVVRDILARQDTSELNEWYDWGTGFYPGTPENGKGVYRQPPTPASMPSGTITRPVSNAMLSAILSSPNPGVETELAGTGASPNVGGTSFRGAVLLDMRNVTTGDPEYYNGLTPDNTVNTEKDRLTYQIINGYSGGPPIEPGTQLAYIDGVSAGNIIDAFDRRYNVGDIVTTLVYNGTVYFDTDFTVRFPSSSINLNPPSAGDFYTSSPPFPSSDPICDLNGYEEFFLTKGSYNDAGDEDVEFGEDQLLKYTIAAKPLENNATGANNYLSNFRTRAFLSLPPGDWNKPKISWNDGSSWLAFGTEGASDWSAASGGTSGEVQRRFMVSQTETATCEAEEETTMTVIGSDGTTTVITETVTIPYSLPKPFSPSVGTIYLETEDTISKQRRGQYAFFALDPSDPVNQKDFFAYIPGTITYDPVVLKTNGDVTIERPVILRPVGNVLNDTPIASDLKVSNVNWSIKWFQGDMNQTLMQPTGITAALVDTRTGPKLQIRVGANATPNRNYYLRVQITNSFGKTQWLWYYLTIKPNQNNSKNVSEYVYALGYANFIITAIDSNQIRGRAISGLLAPGDVLGGMQPRLIPWND
ncbi:MAG TPA: pilus assembly protein TadG-related protein [Chloroflexaceae bacterium]|nr:pilus assembly protein TadG-related protein [Chloroflexaceae bacterium]